MNKPETFVEIEFKDIPKYLDKGYVVVAESIITKRFYYKDHNFIVEYEGNDFVAITQCFAIINSENISFGAFKREEFDKILKSLI